MVETSASKTPIMATGVAVATVACAMALTPGVAMADEVTVESVDVEEPAAVEVVVEEESAPEVVESEEPISEVVDVEEESEPVESTEDDVSLGIDEAVIPEDDADQEDEFTEPEMDGPDPDEDVPAAHVMTVKKAAAAQTPQVTAETEEAEVEAPVVRATTHEVSNETEMLAAIANANAGDTIKLTGNMTASKLMHIAKALHIDLGGFTYTFAGSAYGWLINGSDAVVTIANGSLVCDSTYGIVVNGGDLTLDGVELVLDNAKADAAVQAQLGGSLTLKDTTIDIAQGHTNGVKGVSLHTDATLDMDASSSIVSGVENAHGVHLANGSDATIAGSMTLTGNMSVGVSNNGADMVKNTVTLEQGSVIDVNGVGMYLPAQNSVATINGGTITATLTGVEIRGGELIVNDGAITSTADKYEVKPNGSGSTVTGAAIAESMHTHKGDVSVTINGGKFTGPVAVSQRDPQSVGDVTDVALLINGGTFIGAEDGQPVIDSENLIDYTNGGEYNKYGAWAGDTHRDGLSVIYKDGMYVVGETADMNDQSAGYIVKSGMPIYFADKAELDAAAEEASVVAVPSTRVVQIMDGQGNVVKTLTVNYGSEISSDEMPEMESLIEIDGKYYKFKGWDNAGDPVTSNTTINPVYELVAHQPEGPTEPEQPGDNEDPSKPVVPEVPEQPSQPGVDVPPVTDEPVNPDTPNDPAEDGDEADEDETDDPMDKKDGSTVIDKGDSTETKFIPEYKSGDDLAQTSDETGVAVLGGLGAAAAMALGLSRRRMKE